MGRNFEIPNIPKHQEKLQSYPPKGFAFENRNHESGRPARIQNEPRSAAGGVQGHFLAKIKPKAVEIEGLKHNLNWKDINAQHAREFFLKMIKKWNVAPAFRTFYLRVVGKFCLQYTEISRLAELIMKYEIFLSNDRNFKRQPEMTHILAYICFKIPVEISANSENYDWDFE